MDTQIIATLRTAPAGLTTKALTAKLKSHYPAEGKELKTKINGLLFGPLSKSGRVVTTEQDGLAPIWRLNGKTLVFVDLVTADRPYPVGEHVRYFGSEEAIEPPAGSELSPHYRLKLAMAVATAQAFGDLTTVVTTDEGLLATC
jgi:hypothetical protein